MKKENQRITLTKKMLQEGLLRLLRQKPLEKINVSELCRESDINRTTFYKHYASPHDVLFDIESDLLRGFVPISGKALTIQNAREYLEQFCTYLYEHAELVKILMRSNTDQDFAHLLNEFNRSLWDIKDQVHSLNHLDAKDLWLISVFLGSGCYNLLRLWLIEDIQKSPKEVAALLYGLIIKEHC